MGLRSTNEIGTRSGGALSHSATPFKVQTPRPLPRLIPPQQIHPNRRGQPRYLVYVGGQGPS